MKSLLCRLWKDEEGAEIAEWVVVVALLVAVAIVIYTNILQDSLSRAVVAIGSKIEAQAS